MCLPPANQGRIGLSQNAGVPEASTPFSLWKLRTELLALAGNFILNGTLPEAFSLLQRVHRRWPLKLPEPEASAPGMESSRASLWEAAISYRQGMSSRDCNFSLHDLLVSGDLVLQLPSVNADIQPVLQTLPLQSLSQALALSWART